MMDQNQLLAVEWLRSITREDYYLCSARHAVALGVEEGCESWKDLIPVRTPDALYVI